MTTNSDYGVSITILGNSALIEIPKAEAGNQNCIDYVERIKKVLKDERKITSFDFKFV